MWHSEEGDVSGVELDFTLGAAQAIDTVAITGHNFSSGAQVLVKAGSSADPDGSEFETEIDYQEDQQTLMKKFAEQTYQYWRLEITDVANQFGYLQLAYVLGGVLEELHYFQFGWKRTRTTYSRSSRTKFGVPMIQSPLSQSKGIAVEWEPMDDTERDTIDVFLRSLHKETVPLLVVPDSDKVEAFVGRLATDYEVEQHYPIRSGVGDGIPRGPYTYYDIRRKGVPLWHVTCSRTQCSHGLPRRSTGEDGLLKRANSGVARDGHYDPSGFRVLLLEGGRVNSFSRSAEIDHSDWNDKRKLNGTG